MIRLRSICLCLLVLPFLAPSAYPTGTIPPLDNFAVLGNSTVTNTGTTTINGNLGDCVNPSGSTCGNSPVTITGFPPGIVNGTMGIDNGDAVAAKALEDASTTFSFLNQTNLASLLGLSVTDETGKDLGNLPTLTSGIYFFSSSAQLTGTLTLSGTGPFIFLTGTTLTTASASSVDLANGANAGDIFWAVGSSATLGTTTSFDGNIIAKDSITLNTGATVCGSVTALTAAVTMDDNTINGSACGAAPSPTPEPSTFLLLATGLLGAPGLFWFRKPKPVS